VIVAFAFAACGKSNDAGVTFHGTTVLPQCVAGPASTIPVPASIAVGLKERTITTSAPRAHAATLLTKADGSIDEARLPEGAPGLHSPGSSANMS
jgi:hypothetical protein